jgi:hypothetical protein
VYSITSSARPSSDWGTVRHLGRLEIDDHLDFRGPLDRQVGGFLRGNRTVTIKTFFNYVAR